MTKFFAYWQLMSMSPPKDALAILGFSVFLLHLVFFNQHTLGLSDLFSSHHVAIASTICNQEEMVCGLFITPCFYTALRIAETMAALVATLI
jgi:hypothetical protein